MYKFENGASIAKGNVAGNDFDQCLGGLHLDFSSPYKPNTTVGDGQPMLNVHGQILGSLRIGRTATALPESVTGDGQHGSNLATDGLNNVKGFGSNNATVQQGAVAGQCGSDSGSGQPMLDEPVQKSGSKNEQLGIGSNNGQLGNDNGRSAGDASKKTYASLFSDNRAPCDASYLTYIEPPVGNLVLETEEIDSVEKAFGFCLIGYVMGPRPSPYAMNNYVKRWDKDVKFTFKENGWIRFQFPNELVRDRVLNGGPYLIFGKQLFLKKLPSCFLFSKEDMVYFPSWIQIFGLPADCWTTKALSKIASVVGKPLHTDMLTISKKGATFARVLVELDAQKQRVREYSVVLPTGNTILINFKYEFEPKFCEKCDCLGHSVEMCGIEPARRRRRPPRQSAFTREQPVGHSEAPTSTAPDNLKDDNIPKISEEIPIIIELKEQSYADILKLQLGSEEQVVDIQQRDTTCMTLEREARSIQADMQLPLDAAPVEHHEALDTLGGHYSGIYVSEDDKSVDDYGLHPTHEEDIDMDTDDILDDLAYVIYQSKKDWKTVSGRKRINKKKKKCKDMKEGGATPGLNGSMGRSSQDMETPS